MGYICRCRCEGWGLPGVYSGIGYINQEFGSRKGNIFRETEQLVKDFSQD